MHSTTLTTPWCLDRSATPTYRYDIATAITEERYAIQYEKIEYQHTDKLYNSLQCILSDDHNGQEAKDSIRNEIVTPAINLAWEVCHR
jgi:hypothetical protein